MARSKTALRESLLPTTVEQAREIPFYASLWSSADLPADSRAWDVTTLDRVPVITKESPGGGAGSVLHPGRKATMVIRSSGSTGRPFVRYRGPEELRAYADFGTAIRRAAAGRGGGAPPPTVHASLLTTRTHASLLGTAGADRTLSLALVDGNDLERALDLLAAEPLFPGLEGAVVDITGNPGDLMLLGAGLARRGLVRDGFITRVVVVSDYLSPLVRDYLRSVFGSGTDIVERYSMSEVVGGATVCPACDALHFDPVVVPQVVALDDDSPVTAGIGRMVLTELHPFSQVQPLLRYDNGDLVERVAGGCEPDEVTVSFVGRRAETPAARDGGRTRVVLRPRGLRDALERFTEIARPPLHPRITSPLHGGAPLVHTEWTGDGPVRITVRAVPAFDPNLFPAAAGQLRDRVHAAVLGCCPEIGPAVADGFAEVGVELEPDRAGVAGFTVRRG